MADYEFRYAPLTGRLTGKQMIEQTEQAINQLSSLVDSAAGQVEIISTLANEANENAATALEVANEALSTTGRTYITVSTQTDANNYYDSQLIYIADSTSTNIPVADTGMLEVKTNDDKTACEQVFIADSSGDAYYRHGDITAETVGDVTTYTVTWGGWSSQPASQQYVQEELVNYLPLSGGTVTGGLTVEGTITGNLAGNADTATNAANDANGNPIASTYLPLAGGTMSGAILWSGTVYDVIKRDSGNDGVCIIGGDADNFSGASLQLFGQTQANYAGRFYLRASTRSDVNDTSHPSVDLTGNPNGSLTWGGKEVERVNAKGSNYIRYDSGLQICSGGIAISGNGDKTVTYGASFATSQPICVLTSLRYASPNEQASIYDNGPTGFKATITNAGTNNHTLFYCAIGYWK